MITVVRPPLSRAPFGVELTSWLEAGIVGTGRTVRADAAVAVVPEYLHVAPRAVLAGLAARDWRGTAVAVVSYGGRGRGRAAAGDAREVLRLRGALLVPLSLGIDVSAVRRHGFDEADVVLRDLVLDEVAQAARSTPA